MNKSTTSEQENFSDMKFWEIEQEQMAADVAGQHEIDEMAGQAFSPNPGRVKKKKHRKHGKKRKSHARHVQPAAVFYGNSINFGPIGVPGRATEEAARQEISRLIRYYERLLTKKDRKINDLETDLEIFMPVRDEWKEAV